MISRGRQHAVNIFSDCQNISVRQRQRRHSAFCARAVNDRQNQLTLLIHPLILGGGQRLFTESGSFAALRLVDSKSTTTGVIISTYQPAAP